MSGTGLLGYHAAADRGQLPGEARGIDDRERPDAPASFDRKLEGPGGEARGVELDDVMRRYAGDPRPILRPSAPE